MRAIIVDDEMLMIRRFVRLSSEIEDLNVVGQFDCAEDAIGFVGENPVEAAFIDVEMPIINGIELAKKLRGIRSDIIIVFISAYEEYIRDSNEIGGDYYIVKPYTQKTLGIAMERIRLLARRQHKQIYVQTFGRFMLLKNGEPVHLSGKAKEILALVITRRGREISNEEIYNTIWEGRPYSNSFMSVYYNALRRLRTALKKEGIEGILVSTSRGQTVNTDLFDCDYYAWKDKNPDERTVFEGEFMSEYSWGEYILGGIIQDENYTFS